MSKALQRKLWGVKATPVAFAVVEATGEKPLAATETLATRVFIQAKLVDGDNTGNVFIGPTSLVAGTAEKGIELIPGAFLELQTNEGELLDLNEIYVEADTAGDGVVGFYYPRVELGSV